MIVFSEIFSEINFIFIKFKISLKSQVTLPSTPVQTCRRAKPADIFYTGNGPIIKKRFTENLSNRKFYEVFVEKYISICM